MAPHSCSTLLPLHWVPQAMAGSGRRLNLVFPAVRSDLRSVGGPGGENRLIWFLPADRSWLEMAPGKSRPVAPPAAVQ